MAKKKRPARRLDVRVEVPRAPERGRLYLDSDLAELIKKLAKVERVDISGFVEMVLRYWLRNEHPTWEIVEEGTSTLAADLQAAKDVGGIFKP